MTYRSSCLCCCSRGLRRRRGGCWIGPILPELDAAIDGVAVGSESDMSGKIFHQFGVATAEENGVADQRRPEAFDDVENLFSPAFHAAAFETSEADVVFVGAVLSVGEVGQFE